MEIYNRATVTTDPTTGDYNKMVKDAGRVDQEGFLQLLAAQLSNQDPMNPMSNEQMIGQMNQMASLEELTKINSNLTQFNQGQQMSQSSSLIGKAVYGINAETGDELAGVIDGIMTEGGKVYAHVKGETDEGLMDVDSILSIADPNSVVEEETVDESGSGDGEN